MKSDHICTCPKCGNTHDVSKDSGEQPWVQYTCPACFRVYIQQRDPVGAICTNCMRQMVEDDQKW